VTAGCFVRPRVEAEAAHPGSWVGYLAIIMNRQERRPWKRTRVAGAVAVVAFLVLSAVLFVWPRTDAPRRVDAIVVLGGASNRVTKGLKLASEGYAPTLLISTPDASACRYRITGVTVICFKPSPESTQGEARYVAKLASERHWSQILVVSGTAQTLRARLRFDRCYHGTALFDPAGVSTLIAWVRDVFYEWGALAKALTTQLGC
jgi:uncharacterized SAM-binding protein YcdF (DUF218 family)